MVRVGLCWTLVARSSDFSVQNKFSVLDSTARDTDRLSTGGWFRCGSGSVPNDRR